MKVPSARATAVMALRPPISAGAAPTVAAFALTGGRPTSPHAFAGARLIAAELRRFVGLRSGILRDDGGDQRIDARIIAGARLLRQRHVAHGGRHERTRGVVQVDAHGGREPDAQRMRLQFIADPGECAPARAARS